MIAVTALRLAGPSAVLASRPRGVLHVYVGPLTPSGCYIPRAAKAVCRSRTRRLGVRPRGAVEPGRRVCERCAGVLARQPRPASRGDYLARFGHVTAGDLAAEAECATTPAWVDVIAHLSLLVLGVRANNEAVPGGNGSETFHDLIRRRRRAVDPDHPDWGLGARYRGQEADNRLRKHARAAAIRQENEDRIERLGIRLAKPRKQGA